MGRFLVVVASVVVLGLGGLLARPPSTALIIGADGEVLPGPIAELTSVRLGGHDQALIFRGRSTEDPVLLHLAGGPGGTDVGAMRADTGLEEHFVKQVAFAMTRSYTRSIVLRRPPEDVFAFCSYLALRRAQAQLLEDAGPELTDTLSAASDLLRDALAELPPALVLGDRAGRHELQDRLYKHLTDYGQRR